mmetsp:Transcript_117935/g.279935  ORF Transcript_117935/g.279935 Transcript_117935/m.279935 type:complete len:233 (+) Transcript_117935:1692-2390(+)
MDIQLQTDHEQEEHQAKVGDLGHVVMTVNQVQAKVGAHKHTTQQISQDQRLLQDPDEEGHKAATGQTERNVRQQLGHFTAQPTSVVYTMQSTSVSGIVAGIVAGIMAGILAGIMAHAIRCVHLNSGPFCVVRSRGSSVVLPSMCVGVAIGVLTGFMLRGRVARTSFIMMGVVTVSTMFLCSDHGRQVISVQELGNGSQTRGRCDEDEDDEAEGKEEDQELHRPALAQSARFG